MCSFEYASPQNGSIDPETSSFLPLPELQRSDADIYLFFLTAAGVLNFEPVLDDWYKATRFEQELYREGDTSGHVSIYRQNEPGSPQGCLEQHQICLPDAPSNIDCTPLMSFADIQDSRSTIALLKNASEERRQGVQWMVNTTINKMMRTMHPVSGLGIQALTARVGLDGGHQGPLPTNQWQLEVQHWYDTIMAQLQAQFVDTVKGPPNPQLEPVYRFAKTNTENQLCQNQVGSFYPDNKCRGGCAKRTLTNIPQIEDPCSWLSILQSIRPHPSLPGRGGHHTGIPTLRPDYSVSETQGLPRIRKSGMGIK